MRMTTHQKLHHQLKQGCVYRREALLPFSKAVDRDLQKLVKNGVLEKLAPGLYHALHVSRYGVLPPDDEELVRSFLRDDFFLMYSWNQYNALGLGLTQLYNRMVVYNRKRHGLFKLGGKTFDFKRPSRGFPETLSPEFLLIDLLNNLHEIAEDSEFVKTQIKKNLHRFDKEKINAYAKRYGKINTKRFFEQGK